MARLLVVNCLILLFFAEGLRADEPFFVFAPDQAQKQIVCVVVKDHGDRVSLERAPSISLPFGPGGITLSHDAKLLYATSSGRGDAQVASIELLADGRTNLIEAANLGHGSGYTSVDRTGKFFLSANYPAGLITVHEIKSNGAVGKLTCSLKTNKEAHCILTSPDNRYAYVPCVKNNNGLFQFVFDDSAGTLTPLSPFDAKPPAMFGPRHYVYHPAQPVVYFSNEQQLGVSVFRIGKDGQLTDLQHAATMPRRSPFMQGKRDLHASDLAISADGKRLFVAVRDFEGDEDSVFAFAVGDDGKLTLLARTKTGNIPWKVDISPDGQLLLVSESDDRKLSAYRIQKDGTLTRVGEFAWKVKVRDMIVVQSAK